MNESQQVELRRLQMLIGMYMQENKQLLSELGLIRLSGAQSTGDRILGAQMAELDLECGRLNSTIDSERTRNKSLTKRVTELSDAVNSQVGELSKLNKAKSIKLEMQSSRHMSRQVTLLENRLDRLINTFNKLTVENRTLRESVDLSRVENKRLQEVFAKSTESLESRKLQIAELINKSRELFTRRDETSTKLQRVKAESASERAAFDAEMQQLLRMLQYDEKMRSVMATRDPSKGREGSGSGPASGSGSNVVSGQASRKTSPTVSASGDVGAGGTNSMSHTSKPSQVSVAEEIGRLQEAFGLLGLDVISHKFLALEAGNYSMMMHVKSLEEHLKSILERKAASEKGIGQVGSAPGSGVGGGSGTGASASAASSSSSSSSASVRSPTVESALTVQSIVSGIESRIRDVDRKSDLLSNQCGAVEKRLSGIRSVIEGMLNQVATARPESITPRTRGLLLGSNVSSSLSALQVAKHFGKEAMVIKKQNTSTLEESQEEEDKDDAEEDSEDDSNQGQKTSHSGNSALTVQGAPLVGTASSRAASRTNSESKKQSRLWLRWVLEGQNVIFALQAISRCVEFELIPMVKAAVLTGRTKDLVPVPGVRISQAALTRSNEALMKFAKSKTAGTGLALSGRLSVSGNNQASSSSIGDESSSVIAKTRRPSFTPAYIPSTVSSKDGPRLSLTGHGETNSDGTRKPLVDGADIRRRPTVSGESSKAGAGSGGTGAGSSTGDSDLANLPIDSRPLTRDELMFLASRKVKKLGAAIAAGQAAHPGSSVAESINQSDSQTTRTGLPSSQSTRPPSSVAGRASTPAHDGTADSIAHSRRVATRFSRS